MSMTELTGMLEALDGLHGKKPAGAKHVKSVRRKKKVKP